jgi:hypothetical protein
VAAGCLKSQRASQTGSNFCQAPAHPDGFRNGQPSWGGFWLASLSQTGAAIEDGLGDLAVAGCDFARRNGRSQLVHAARTVADDRGHLRRGASGVQGQFAQTGAFAETGGTTALSGGSATDNQIYSTLGMRAAFAPIVSVASIVPHIDLGWQHGFNILRPGQTVTLQSLSQSFAVLGVPLAPDAAAARVGFDIALAPHASLSLDYDGSFANRVQNNAIRGGLEWKF